MKKTLTLINGHPVSTREAATAIFLAIGYQWREQSDLQLIHNGGLTRPGLTEGVMTQIRAHLPKVERRAEKLFGLHLS